MGIQLPENSVSDLFAYASGLIGDFYLIIALVIGIPLAFWVADEIILVLRGQFSDKETVDLGEIKIITTGEGEDDFFVIHKGDPDFNNY